MLQLFWIFIKICITSFGGGSVIISLLNKEFVETGIINSVDFLQSVAIAQSTPGPIAGSVATLIGYRIHGIVGILIANIGVTLPSLLIIPGVVKFLNKYKESMVIENVMKILRPITIAIILSVLIFFINSTVLNGASILRLSDIVNNFNVGALLILMISLFLTIKYRTNPMYIVLISGVLGAIIL